MVLIVRGTAPFGRHPKSLLKCVVMPLRINTRSEAKLQFFISKTFPYDDVFRKILSGITDIPLFPSAQFFYWYFLPTTANSLL